MSKRLDSDIRERFEQDARELQAKLKLADAVLSLEPVAAAAFDPDGADMSYRHMGAEVMALLRKYHEEVSDE